MINQNGLTYPTPADLSSPGVGFKTIANVASDAADIPNGPCRFLQITQAGNIRVVAPTGDDSGVIAVPVGQFWIRCQRIFATGTTALGLVCW